MNIVALIPARGGSKSIPKKSIQMLFEYPIIAYSIAAASLSAKINRIVISTDSPEIAETGRSFGAEIPFLRPAELAKDNSPDIEFVTHALNWFEQNEGKIPDYIVHLRPTTPLRDPQIVDKAIDSIVSNSDATSLRSAHPASESPFKWFLINETGFFKSLRDDFSNDFINQPRQIFPDVYIPDGYVDVLKSDFIVKNKIMYGDRMLGFVSPTCTEIDSLEDFEYLEFQMRRHGSPLLDHLRGKFPLKKP
ncbi:MAG: acylneuraminate cytidylyltransferase family protein [Candidatus Riflebacteria bacterium]|nr:acylneuraminate cytidylyltransferase family protein [Candidatus Riflebacteria bacterium]